MIGWLVLWILKRDSDPRGRFVGVNPKAMVDSYPPGHVVSFNYTKVEP